MYLKNHGVRDENIRKGIISRGKWIIHKKRCDFTDEITLFKSGTFVGFLFGLYPKYGSLQEFYKHSLQMLIQSVDSDNSLNLLQTLISCILVHIIRVNLVKNSTKVDTVRESPENLVGQDSTKSVIFSLL